LLFKVSASGSVGGATGCRKKASGNKKADSYSETVRIFRYHRGIVTTASTRLEIFQILEKNEFSTGSVHQMFQAAYGLQDRGHRVTIVSREGVELRRRAGDHDLSFEAIPLRNELDLSSIRALAALIRNKRPDVIHVHKGLSQSLALAAAWLHPVRCFVVNRGVSFPLDVWNRHKYRTRRVDRIVTVCHQIKDVIVDTGKVPAAKVDVIYAGTDLSIFNPEILSTTEFRDEQSIGRDRFLIAQVGVRDWKGWRELIDSFGEVAAVRPEAHLALIGCTSEELKTEVKAYALSRGVAEKVSAIGVRNDIASVLNAADLVVDASWAGTGITGTIREAMALGKPVIATDCGGNVELISSPELGWLVGPKQREALTGTILEVMDDPDRRARVALEGMRHVRRGFSKDERIKRLEGLYYRIIGSKSR